MSPRTQARKPSQRKSRPRPKADAVQPFDGGAALLSLPTEIKHMIWAYTLSTENTKSPSQPLRPITRENAERLRILEHDEVCTRREEGRSCRTCGSRLYTEDVLHFMAEKDSFKNPKMMDLPVLALNKQISAEIINYIYSFVPAALRWWCLKDRSYRNTQLHKCRWNAREKEVLRYARRVHIELNIPDFADQHCWITATPDVVGYLPCRRDLFEVHLSGSGWEAWPLQAEFSGYYEEKKAREKLQRILGQFLRVKAVKGITFKWEGDEVDPVHQDRFFLWYRQSVQQLAESRSGK